MSDNNSEEESRHKQTYERPTREPSPSGSLSSESSYKQRRRSEVHLHIPKVTNHQEKSVGFMWVIWHMKQHLKN